MQTQIDDTRFRMVLIPMFGIIIPLITGMTRTISMHPFQLLSAFMYTIFIAFVVWQGNRYFLFTLRDYFDWFNKPVKRIVALLIAIFFYTVPVSVLMHLGWYHILNKGEVDWNTIYLSTSIILICVIFISHTYETVFLVKESENEKLKSEQLQRAKTEAELQALNSQVDPHFLFNSLNTLSHLIEETPQKAVEYNDNLAGVYRYILQKRFSDIVPLQDELDFAERYFALLQKRFGPAVQLRSHITDHARQTFYLPPISIQILVENAIKHNGFDEQRPLLIRIEVSDDQLTVENNRTPRIGSGAPGGTGLHNLDKRYQLLAHRSLKIIETPETYSVTIPLLKPAT
jgi:sensor histidine kinase YesM